MDDPPRLTTPQPRPRLVVRKFRVVVTAGPDKGKAVTADGQTVLIGTQQPAEMLLTDPKVSRLHCELAVTSGRVIIRDEGSLNGTTVDGVTIFKAELRDGQTIGVGDSKLRFELGQDRATIAVSEQPRFGRLVGESLAMRAMFVVLERAAQTDATVLLEGEAGTGKEATAESIHDASARSGGPLIVVDCSAIPSNLLESELFGHEQRLGAFELADKGTIFLAEIGELGLDLQPKLLRVLENHEIKRVGARPIDVRVIAATNRSLRHEVNDKRFRADLYHRLAVLQIKLPPLRERLGDLPMLVEHFLEKQPGDHAALRSAAFLDELARHRWSGNVRELRSYLERCVALGEQPPVDDAGPEGGLRVDPTLPIRVMREQWLSVLERKYVAEVLKLAGNNLTQAAKLAGIGRVQLWRLLQRHGLHRG